MKMRCDAETDPNTQLHITWTHQGKAVPLSSIPEGSRVYVDNDRSLVVNLTHTTKAQARLLGRYTCVADNGISDDEISFQVVEPVRRKHPNRGNVGRSIETERAEAGSTIGGFSLQGMPHVIRGV